jgi:hypothetical protein
MSNLEEIIRRHWIIHDYIIGRTWDSREITEITEK